MSELQIHQITAMSSREISELTGKRHGNVLRDIQAMLTELYPDEMQSIDFEGNSDLSYLSINGLSFHRDGPINRVAQIDLDFDHTMTLITGYSAKLRLAVVRRWRELEAAEAIRAEKQSTLEWFRGLLKLHKGDHAGFWAALMAGTTARFYETGGNRRLEAAIAEAEERRNQQ